MSWRRSWCFSGRIPMYFWPRLWIWASMLCVFYWDVSFLFPLFPISDPHQLLRKRDLVELQLVHFGSSTAQQRRGCQESERPHGSGFQIIDVIKRVTWEDERGEREIREMGEKWRLETMTEAGGSHLTPLGHGLMTFGSLFTTFCLSSLSGTFFNNSMLARITYVYCLCFN